VGQNEGMAPTHSLHVVAMESGLDRAAELVPAARRSGRTVVGHVLRPPLAGEPEAARLGDEQALLRAAARECLDDEGVLLLADERGALVVPEAMRVLLDERGLGWDDAWARVGASTIARFGSPKSEPSRPFWTVPFLEAADPRLLEIVYEINRRHLDVVEARWPGDVDRRRRLSIVREGDPKRLRPGVIAILAARRADVATPWDGPAGEILADLAVLCSRTLHSRPTPVFVRSWLHDANPELGRLLTDTVGRGWAKDPSALGRLEGLAFDAGFRSRFRDLRRASRERLGTHLRAHAGIETSPEALVDVRVGALGAHERPLLTALWLVREHLRLATGGWRPPAARTVVVARSAEAAGDGSDRVVALLEAVAVAINVDPRVEDALRVAVLPACEEDELRRLAGCADLSSQPGTAGSGAAGARALGLAVNGAVTLGTADGTVRELVEVVSAENVFLFGLGPLETRAWREGRVYRPQDVYAIDPLVRLSLDALLSTRYAPFPGAHDWVRHELLDEHDPWLVIADFGAYIHRQDEALAEFADPRAFTEKAVITLARARRFWVDELEVDG
jgi:starch phosphorylase